MKKTIIILLLTIVFLISPNSLKADTFLNQVPKKVNYQLPYPGVLPDNPIYFFKNIRDKILLFITEKGRDKADRLLLYSDKKISMSRELMKKGKVKLSLKTAISAEEDFNKLITEIQDNQITDPEFTSKVKLSSDKHKEVIIQLITDSQLPETNDLVKTLLKLTEKNLQEVTKI
ncbi:MAG: hypothetical protein KatS3mg090_0556 [Patescibacteria group bacterium]|nr:MAG: hypothetical protein KatS3mg090_0556 [Patescibacteria group bacterium]